MKKTLFFLGFLFIAISICAQTPTPIVTPTPTATPLSDWQSSNFYGTPIRGFITDVSSVIVQHNYHSFNYAYSAWLDDGSGIVIATPGYDSITFTAYDIHGVLLYHKNIYYYLKD